MRTKDETPYTLLRVRVQPKASRNAIKIDDTGLIRVALTAAPVDGAANLALRELVAKVMGLPKGAVSVVSGEKSREKMLRLDGIGGDVVRERLPKT